jgi:hypothetical protein
LKNKKNILYLLSRFLFFCYFAVWLFATFSFLQYEYYNYSSQRKEAYLLSSQVDSFLFNGPEENKKLKFSEGKISGFFKYLTPFSLQISKLSGNFHFINADELPAFVSIYSSINCPRLPPGSDSRF